MVFEYIKDIIKINIKREKIISKNKKRKCYIMMAGNYGNIGDIAITIAQKKFIEKTLKDYEIIEVPLDKIYLLAKSIKKNINQEDIITIVGGGNSGNVYLAFEKARRFIALYFRKFRIISFPQTIDFTTDKLGKKELKKSKKFYDLSNIIFFAREEKSLKFYKENFKNNVYLVPDIVLSMMQEENNDRDGVILCFRNDKELINNKTIKNSIVEYLENNKISYKYQDTYVGDVIINEKEMEFNKLLNIFKSSKLVITDRLHGMIFCAITGTPCIALNNSNRKIEYTYKKWLQNIDNIRFVDKKYKVDYIIKQLYNSNNYKIQIEDLQKEYDVLINTLLKQ